MDFKIGKGGFGAVYYAELKGKKAPIKEMGMKASKEFHVHHRNLVCLIGYCTEVYLFLIYEFMENGNLRQHLRDSGDPLPWSTRLQITLDSARGLEYIHEYTVPVHIHRDIKSENILIDRNFHGKVADFGLAKLTGTSTLTHSKNFGGTFGYMAPECGYGNVSPKVDVYAFGVVLYELISAKEAIVRTNGSNATPKGLIQLFEDILNQPDPEENLRELVDPRLGDSYPFDMIYEMAQLAKICTHQCAEFRPSMRSVVVALTTLSSKSEDWDLATFCNNRD